MAKKGLKKWFSEKWVDIGAKRKNGKYQPCGRSTSNGSSRKKNKGGMIREQYCRIVTGKPFF